MTVSASAIYEGTIRHRRYAVRQHEFSHRLALAYLDLDELDGLLGGRLAASRPGLVRFRRADYLGDPATALTEAVRREVERATGERPAGPIRLLTQLRTLGHCFNPVSFYYCFTPCEQLEAVVAEVTSTPWGERHAYVLRRTAAETVSVASPTPAGTTLAGTTPAGTTLAGTTPAARTPAGTTPAARTPAGRTLAGSFQKELHVSPFMGMEQRYLWRVAAPGATLSVHIESRERERRAFDATLTLRRLPLTRGGLARVTARYPAATLRVLALIYGHALALKLKGVPVHRRPRVQA